MLKSGGQKSSSIRAVIKRFSFRESFEKLIYHFELFSGKHFDVEELFRGRIEAPNKTHILDTIFKGYDKRIRPHYRGKGVALSLSVAGEQSRRSGESTRLPPLWSGFDAICWFSTLLLSC